MDSFLFCSTKSIEIAEKCNFCTEIGQIFIDPELLKTNPNDYANYSLLLSHHAIP